MGSPFLHFALGRSHLPDSTLLFHMYFSQRHLYITQGFLQVFLWLRHSENNKDSMVGFTIIRNCVRFSEKVIQMMGMEATVHISLRHSLTNTKKGPPTLLTVKLSWSWHDKSHCLALHCIAGIHLATFNIVIVSGAKVKINESNI